MHVYIHIKIFNNTTYFYIFIVYVYISFFTFCFKSAICKTSKIIILFAYTIYMFVYNLNIVPIKALSAR